MLSSLNVVEFKKALTSVVLSLYTVVITKVYYYQLVLSQTFIAVFQLYS